MIDGSDSNFSVEELERLYKEHQVVRVANLAPRNSTTLMNWKTVHSLFGRLNARDQASWCVEKFGNQDEKEQLVADEFLQPSLTNDRAYCSFLVQNDKSVYDDLLNALLPLPEIPDTCHWHYERALWFFFGRNPLGNTDDLPGRPEHTDSVSHDGTWHWQLSGRKRWFLRPTKDLLEKQQSSSVIGNDTLEVVCGQGDLLIVNTRLWFHQTTIPPQPFPSVTYARDFYMRGMTEGTDNMSNVDGLYATEPIEEGTVIFREDQMPECELHRSSTNPNCSIVELEDGQGAVVSTRDIATGEFFAVPPSSDEEEEEEEEEE